MLFMLYESGFQMKLFIISIFIEEIIESISFIENMGSVAIKVNDNFNSLIADMVTIFINITRFRKKAFD